MYKASSVLGPDFSEILHRYQDMYSHLFPPMEESKDGESYTHTQFTTEQFEVHRRFAQECNDVLENYGESFFLSVKHYLLRRICYLWKVSSTGISTEALFEECQESLDGKWCALFEEDVNQWFVDLCVNLQDFEWFASKIRRDSYNESKH